VFLICTISVIPAPAYRQAGLPTGKAGAGIQVAEILFISFCFCRIKFAKIS